MHVMQLPPLGAALDDGIFAGLATKPDGTYCAVVLLADKPGGKLIWQQAVEWAQSVQGELPSRPVSALLFANARDQFERAWHWTSETDEDDGSFAWYQGFSGGSQLQGLKSYATHVRAVRLIPLEIT
jgi:hypothetical protein